MTNDATPQYQSDVPETLEHAPDVYATGITRQDVEELRTFLRARCDESYARYRPDAPEARRVQAFHEAASTHLTDLEELVADRRPEKLSDRALAWDLLMHIVAPWRGTPGHNGARWRTLVFDSELDRATAQRRSAR